MSIEAVIVIVGVAQLAAGFLLAAVYYDLRGATRGLECRGRRDAD